MRLLILHLATVFGGAERTTSNLLTHLDRNLVRHVTLAAPAALRDFLSPSFDAFIDTTPHLRHGSFNTPSDLHADARACGQLLRDAKPDLVLGMMHYSATLAVLGTRLARLPIKTVGSYRGPAYEYMRRYEQGFGRWAFLLAAISGTARWADRMIVPSEGVARELRRRFLGSAKRTIVIPNGIDSAKVSAGAMAAAPELERLPKDLPLLCVAARLSPEKDMDLLLTAFRLLQARRPVALAVVGDGPDRGALEDQIAAWGLQDRVVFVGHRNNVYPYMRRADLYVHTCQFEGFGYAMLEAMACGTPVIATDCPYGPREVIGNNQYGLLVPSHDAAALAAGIGQLLDNPEHQLALAELGLARAEHLSISRMTTRYEAVFSGLLPTCAV